MNVLHVQGDVRALALWALLCKRCNIGLCARFLAVQLAGTLKEGLALVIG